jgi:phasin family protein
MVDMAVSLRRPDRMEEFMETQFNTDQVEKMTADAQKTMEEGVEKMSKGMEDMAEFNRQNMEAVVASSKRVAKAAEEINAELAAYAKKSYEDGMAAMKEMSAAKSMTELFEKQQEFARASLEAFIAESSKLNDMTTDAAKECFEPFSERMTAAGDIVKSASA